MTNRMTDEEFLEYTSNMNKYRHVVNFPNGYGASIICKVQYFVGRHSEEWVEDVNGGASDGLFEVAILHEGEICWGHPLVASADDSQQMRNETAFFYSLDFEDVAGVLEEIEKLPVITKDNPMITGDDGNIVHWTIQCETVHDYALTDGEDYARENTKPLTNKELCTMAVRMYRERLDEDAFRKPVVYGKQYYIDGFIDGFRSKVKD